MGHRSAQCRASMLRPNNLRKLSPNPTNIFIQGGCMAIEDAFELANDLEGAMKFANTWGSADVDVEKACKLYELRRNGRVSSIHGMARMAADMASTYKVCDGWCGCVCMCVFAGAGFGIKLHCLNS